MPSVCLYEGDLNTVMTMLREFAGRLDQYGGVLAAIAKDVRDLQALSTMIPASQESASYRCAPVASLPPLTAQSAGEIPGNSTGNDWAAIASKLYKHGSRFAVLTTDDDGDAADGQPFTLAGVLVYINCATRYVHERVI